MARLPRFAAADQPQHVIHRGNNKTRLFADARDFYVFRECLTSAMQRFPCQLHAYVFMTNHVHFLLSAAIPGTVGKMMQSLGRRHVRYFNDRNGRTGTLWEGRYRATVIHSEKYLFTCYRYIEENPVRAGMVRHPAEYRWSSHGSNAMGGDDALVTPHVLYDALGTSARERQMTYRALFREPVNPVTLDTIRDATNHAWALGDSVFHERLARVGRRATRTRRAPRAVSQRQLDDR